MKTIAPIRERGLPHLSVADVRAARLAQRLLARLPARVEVSLGSLGPVTIAVVGPVARDGTRPLAVSFGLGRSLVEGRLSIDAALAHRLVAATLGEDVVAGPPLLGPLGFGERGLVAGLVARVLQRLGAPLVLALEAPARAQRLGSEMLVLTLELTVLGWRGWAELEVPACWVEERLRGSLDRAALGALTVVARVELGTTDLAAVDLATLAIGDAVVFDGHASPGEAGAAWRSFLVVGDAAADASLTPAGRIEIVGPFSRPRVGANRGTNRAEEGIVSNDTAPQDEVQGRAANDDTTRLDVTAVLAAAPIEVVAEVGRLVLRGEEVLGLAPGSVLMLGGARASEVTLRVGDEVWAEGELVDVDGALAVRVTRVARPAG